MLPRGTRPLLLQPHYRARGGCLLTLRGCQAGLRSAGGSGSIPLSGLGSSGRRLGAASLPPSLLQQRRNGGLRLQVVGPPSRW